MRLIDADAMTKYIEETTADNEWLVSQYSAYWIDGFIESRHTVDAVEVVRCRDCQHYKAQSQSVHRKDKALLCCRSATVKVNPNDFCSFGERKDTNVR